MAQNRSYPEVKRSAAVNKGFPSKSSNARDPFKGIGPKATGDKAPGGKSASFKPGKKTEGGPK